jgi:hypothetical protein
MTGSAAALDSVKDRISSAVRKAGRRAGEVTLVAVSKTFAAADIVPVLVAGQRVFGENRVQEAKGKWPELRAQFDGVELHLIGPLQSNKAAEAVALFDVIESVDRPKIAAALAQEMKKQRRAPKVFVQVNTGDESQKAGVSVAESDGFIDNCKRELGLEVAGLMCIPPVGEDPRLHFRILAEIAARHGLTQLSMGMSGDFEIAIEEGATHVRVGSAIFGARG